MYKYILSLALTAGCFTVASGVNAVEKIPTDSPPHHEKIIETLKHGDAVLPWSPEAHPVSTVYNREAIIPPQCYTKTEQQYNPCYVCHQNAIESHSNTMNDGALQLAYSFSDLGMKNAWQNLFEDRANAVAKISDETILQWVNTDNYSALAPRLRTAGFKGWIPDLNDLHRGAAAFDQHGFARDNSHWVAFNYKPMPSTFWPSNGSTDDVMIRLAKTFRQNENGEYSRDIYMANLAILEANIKGLDAISTPNINEKNVGFDLNGDGKLTTISRISNIKHYVGGASKAFFSPYIYPAGTEFFHTVRYLGIDDNGKVGMSTRMKEVRYMKKWDTYGRPEMAQKYYEEALEKEAGNLPGYYNLKEQGLDNGMGWSVSGFMEDANGRLRANTFEENLFCMGCHGSIGTTIDHTFSFARKVDGAAGWTYINLEGMPDAPNRSGDGKEALGEIATYLQRVGGGSEFRNNDEMRKRWFHKNGQLNLEKVQAAPDVYSLIVPSAKRALTLNKAYRVIVAEQDFIYGRDATVTPPANVNQQIDNNNALTLPPEKFYRWDIRLAWPE